MTLLRALGVKCSIHGFTIHKELQLGVAPELVYPLAPNEILHSWIEIETEGGWVNLEGFILDRPFLRSLQAEFEGFESPCGYCAGTVCLSAPPVECNGKDTYIQTTGIKQDFGVFDTPDQFYNDTQQALVFARVFLYRHIIRYWLNAKVRTVGSGHIPKIPGFELSNYTHKEKQNAILKVAQIIHETIAASLALISEALHTFADIASYVVEFLARKFSGRAADEEVFWCPFASTN